MIRKHFRRKRLVLGLAIAALATPVSAQAMVEIGGPTGGETTYVIPTSHGNIVKSPAQDQAAYQLKVDAIRGQALNNAYQVSVDTMRGEKLNKTWADSRVPTAVTSTTSDGFSWSDAGIGAAVTSGVVLFLLTAVGLGRKHRGRIDRSGLARA